MQKKIEKILESYNLSISQFADMLGVQRSSLSHILSGRNNPSLDFTTKLLAAFPEINYKWILFNEGSIYDKTAADLKVDAKYEDRNLGTKDIIETNNEVLDKKEHVKTPEELLNERQMSFFDDNIDAKAKIVESIADQSNDNSLNSVQPEPLNEMSTHANIDTLVVTENISSKEVENMRNNHNNHNHSQSKPEKIDINSSKRQIDRILILYTDGSFDTYSL